LIKEIEMSIEWGIFPVQSAMSMFAHDNTATPPTSILAANAPIFLHLTWEVPAAEAAIIGGNFRIRAFAESMGPGAEKQVGPTHTEPAVPNKTVYDIHIEVPANTLEGEGQLFNGVPVAGLYKLVGVLQHMNPGPNTCSGYADGPLVQLRAP
jgi:hypothetical protein